MVTNHKEQIRYKVILELGCEFIRLVRIGLIPSHLLGWKAIYETFLEEKKKVKKTEAAVITAAKFEISKRQVFVIVKYMES